MKFGGWKKVGWERYKAILELVEKARKKQKHCKAVEEKVLADIRTAYNMDQLDKEREAKKPKKKRKAEVNNIPDDVTFTTGR